MPAVKPKRLQEQHRRLRPQFLIFCVIVALLLAGIILFLSHGIAGWKGKIANGKRPAKDGTRTEEALKNATATDIPAGYVSTESDIGTGSLILVSNDHDYTFPEDVELVVSLENRTARKYFVRDFSIRQEKQAFAVFDKMLCDFADATGHTDVNITSAYRSYEEQENVFNASAAANGEEHARRYVTHPGGSEHHTGLAADLNVYNASDGTSYDFNGQGDYKWLYDHCAEYGVILRYAADKETITGIAPESWHFRYVGIPHAAYITENGLCLEEYIAKLREYTVQNPLQYSGYTIYFCPENELYVPESGNYTVSGNNVDGFIVTVERARVEQ